MVEIVSFLLLLKDKDALFAMEQNITLNQEETSGEDFVLPT